MQKNLNSVDRVSYVPLYNIPYNILYIMYASPSGVIDVCLKKMKMCVCVCASVQKKAKKNKHSVNKLLP